MLVAPSINCRVVFVIAYNINFIYLAEQRESEYNRYFFTDHIPKLTVTCHRIGHPIELCFHWRYVWCLGSFYAWQFLCWTIFNYYKILVTSWYADKCIFTKASFMWIMHGPPMKHDRHEQNCKRVYDLVVINSLEGKCGYGNTANASNLNSAGISSLKTSDMKWLKMFIERKMFTKSAVKFLWFSHWFLQDH